MSCDCENNMPSVDVRPLRLQAAGHERQDDGRNLGILEEEDGKFVLKPKNGDRELAFYQFVFDENCEDPTVISLRQFVPKFHGFRCIEPSDSSSTSTRYLRLENLTHEFENPSIMDVKIGRITSEPEASVDKKEREKLKYQKTKDVLGYCIPGMKVYNQRTGLYDVYDKKFGKSLDHVTIKLALRTFFGDDRTLQVQLASSFLSQMKLIYDWFCTQRIFNFYASSLLFVYSSNSTAIPRIRLVDFVHVIKSDLTDDNFLFGLKNLMEAMNEIIIE